MVWRRDQLNAAFGEPVLQGLDNETVVYRLYLEAATAPVHLMVRVVKNEAGATFVSKRLESEEALGSGRLLWQASRRLSKDEWKRLSEAIAQSGYWSLPVRLKSDLTPFDGYLFTLEGAKGDSRHLVRTRVQEGPIGGVIDYMVKLADCEASQTKP